MKINFSQSSPYILIYSFISVLLLFAYSTFAYADHGSYYLCGTDEDGCDQNNPQYCLCIKENPHAPNQPYCMDLNSWSCTPKPTNGDCGPNQTTTENEAQCLALMMQSEETPVCPKVTKHYCEKHNLPRCEADNVNGCGANNVNH